MTFLLHATSVVLMLVGLGCLIGADAVGAAFVSVSLGALFFLAALCVEDMWG